MNQSSSESSSESSTNALNEPPPVLRSWRNLYTLVILNLITLIALFYALTKAYT